MRRSWSAVADGDKDVPLIIRSVDVPADRDRRRPVRSLAGRSDVVFVEHQRSLACVAGCDVGIAGPLRQDGGDGEALRWQEGAA